MSIFLALAGFSASACADDPQYLKQDVVLEVGITGQDGTVTTSATGQLILPIRLETDQELMERQALATELGVPVPFIALDDLSVSVEWTIENLADTDGTAQIHVNGGNETFAYVPANFVIDPEEEAEPPPLAGAIPLAVPAETTIAGVFREDKIREAAIDLELITRGGTNPFAAVLQQHQDIDEFTDTGGSVIPAEHFGHMVQFDFVFEANRHMVLEYTVRVRDHADVLHELLLDAPVEELTPFAPAAFQPPPPPVE